LISTPSGIGIYNVNPSLEDIGRNSSSTKRQQDVPAYVTDSALELFASQLTVYASMIRGNWKIIAGHHGKKPH
jgi:hypothetical protein